jgi:hypothetical protein
MKKAVKLFFSVIIFSASAVSVSVCNAMKLTKFDKPVADIFSDASLFLLSIIPAQIQRPKTRRKEL